MYENVIFLDGGSKLKLKVLIKINVVVCINANIYRHSSELKY